MTETTRKENLIWISGNDIIERNSQEETRRELFINGYPAKLSSFIERREAALKAQEKELEIRRAALKIKRKNRIEEEEEQAL